MLQLFTPQTELLKVVFSRGWMDGRINEYLWCGRVYHTLCAYKYEQGSLKLGSQRGIGVRIEKGRKGASDNSMDVGKILQGREVAES